MGSQISKFLPHQRSTLLICLIDSEQQFTSVAALRTVIDLPQRWKCRVRSLPARKVHHRPASVKAAATRTVMPTFSPGWLCSDPDEHQQDVWYSDHSSSGV